MRKVILAAIFSFFTALLHAQTESFDIATFTRPPGWERLDSNGTMALHHLKTENGLTSFCQIFLYPSTRSTGNPSKDFSKAWTDYVVKSTMTKTKPRPITEKSPDGWTVVMGNTNVAVQQLNFTCMLVTASGFGKTMSAMVNVAGQDYTSIIDDFFKSLDLDKNASVSNVKPNTTMNITSAGLDSYSFISPENWQSQKGNGFLLLTQPPVNGQACRLTIISPQPSSGNLENDTKSIFSQMYPEGWKFYYSDHRHDDLMKGYTRQGLEYCMMEAPMVRARPDGHSWDYETGSALLINLGTQVAIITLRHESTGVSCQCKQRYDHWGRFFNSFTVKDIPSQTKNENLSRLVGTWKTSGSKAMGDYIFAANGRYQYLWGHGNFTKISPEIIELRTSAFQGDGTYSLNGDNLILKKQGEAAQAYPFRIEKINKGSTGWKERMILLNEHPADKGPGYEVIYEKE